VVRADATSAVGVSEPSTGGPIKRSSVNPADEDPLNTGYALASNAIHRR
jgi:hypothetical protein